MSVESKSRYHDDLTILRDRAQMLHRARIFFSDREIIEVDTPILSPSGSVDAHIDLVSAHCCGQMHYLHSSPEYSMKQLLSKGLGDCYQLSHVFRDEEHGSRHNPEFMLAEWYRIGFTFEKMIKETVSFCQLFIGNVPIEVRSYRELFKLHAQIDPFLAPIEQLREIADDSSESERDALLNLILGLVVEPKLGSDSLVAVTHYPASQAALARKATIDGYEVAERFEIYHQGVELANGYHELADSAEQRTRFEEANKLRQRLGKNFLPIDEQFLESLDQLPNCCGVAVGFDRLMMLRHKVDNITRVLS